MPRVWIVWDGDYSEFSVTNVEPEEGTPDVMVVDMNASLFRQIVAASKKYDKFQGIMQKFYREALDHPGKVRRVR